MAVKKIFAFLKKFFPKWSLYALGILLLVLLVILPLWYFWSDSSKRGELESDIESVGNGMASAVKRGIDTSKDAVSNWWGDLTNFVGKKYEELGSSKDKN